MTMWRVPDLLRRRVCLILAAFVPLGGGSLEAQEASPPDTLFQLAPVVVTAERIQTPLAESVAAVTVLTREELASTSNATLADALRQVPGFAQVDLDGQGKDPQIMARGFYGGGESEYVVVLLDGRPMNDVQSGLVTWDAIPIASVERIEVLRGGASALWGDAAVGGVINVVTRSAVERERPVRWNLGGGSHGSLRGSMDIRDAGDGREWSVFGGVDRTDGFRDHGERTVGWAGGRVELTSSPSRSLHFSTVGHWRDVTEPGPLVDEDLAIDRVESDVFYRFDGTRDRRVQAGLDGEIVMMPRGLLSASVYGERRRREDIRTIALAPQFADTQERALETGRVAGSAQFSLDGTGWTSRDRLVVGMDASRASLDSKYHEMLRGDRGAYLSAEGSRGELDASGEGHRDAAAIFAHYTLVASDRLRIQAGVRGDWLRDVFDEHEPEGGSAQRASHSALSPRLGANFRYADRENQNGHLYLSAGRSFKAATLDQLFDQRRLPVPFPPFEVTTSNALLVPQRGVNVELGLYHSAVLSPRRVVGEFSMSMYQMDMEDELDFDLESLRYVNIGESRHRGIEGGLRVRIEPFDGSLFLNYALQEATSQVGEDAGNYLKAIPRQFLSGGLSASPIGHLETGLVVNHARDIYLDDANTIELPAYTRVDLRLSHPIGGMVTFLDIRNLLDARYSTTGFPDPSGTGAVYYRPSAERTLELGFRGAF